VNQILAFFKLLSNPRISTGERLGIVEKIFGNEIEPFSLSLMKILTKQRDISLIPYVFKEYQDKYYKENNILPVTAISAVELTDNQKQKLIQKLENITNKKVILKNKVDQSSIGGIRLEYSGYMIDASIQNRFNKLEHILKSADYS
jgi:F-type H+-transporting ATPase subunit delta